MSAHGTHAHTIRQGPLTPLPPKTSASHDAIFMFACVFVLVFGLVAVPVAFCWKEPLYVITFKKADSHTAREPARQTNAFAPQEHRLRVMMPFNH